MNCLVIISMHMIYSLLLKARVCLSKQSVNPFYIIKNNGNIKGFQPISLQVAQKLFN